MADPPSPFPSSNLKASAEPFHPRTRDHSPSGRRPWESAYTLFSGEASPYHAQSYLNLLLDPRYEQQGLAGPSTFPPYMLEWAQWSNGVAKHMNTNSHVQGWTPFSTEAVPHTVIKDNMELPGFNKDVFIKDDGSNGSKTYASFIKVDAPLMRFVKGTGGSRQKQIEDSTGVQIIFPSSSEETSVALEGKSAESIRKASQMIANVLEETIQSHLVKYSHFISIPLATHSDHINKLKSIQSSILGHKQADGSDVSIKMQVQEESADPKMGSKGSQSVLGIDESLFSTPKTFHLTVIMLKLWNKERIEKASHVLQSISMKVNEALENRPISIQLRGLECMKGYPAQAKVVYAPVLEVGGEERLERACKIIKDEFAKEGLALESDARQELKLHATVMNVRFRKSEKSDDWFDARDILSKYGEEEWGEYPIREVHLSQRYKYDESGYYHCCSSIPLPGTKDAS